MKVKNVLTVLFVVLVLGALFTGCGKEAMDTKPHNVPRGDIAPANVDVVDESSEPEVEVDEVVESEVDEVEIGSLI